MTASSFGAHVLLHEHGVGAGRHRRAGEDARSPRCAPSGAAAALPAVRRPVTREPRFALGIEIAVAHRVAVDRGVVERRQVERRDHVRGQHPSARRREAHRLCFAHRLHALGDHPLHVRDRQQRPREREAVVGELRHQALRIACAALCSGVACFSSTSAICSMSSRSTTGTLGLRQRRIRGDRDDVRIVGMNQRLAVRRAVDFELGEGVALEALDQHQIDRRQLGQQIRQVPLRLVAQLVQHRKALRRADDHLGRAGGAVHERVLARLVEVEAVVRVLERRDALAARDQARQHLGDQRGLARAAPAGEPDDAHLAVHGASYIAKTPGG